MNFLPVLFEHEETGLLILIQKLLRGFYHASNISHIYLHVYVYTSFARKRNILSGIFVHVVHLSKFAVMHTKISELPVIHNAYK